MKLYALFAAFALACFPAVALHSQNPAPTQTQTQTTNRNSPKPAVQQAPGAGPDKVWVNMPSKVYHCPNDRYYGKTKNGKYMTEADAKAAGAHGVNGKTCFK